MKTFADAEQAINDYVISLDVKSNYKLDRIKSLLNKLNNPQNKIKTVHIAGTSGKTSTCYYLAKLLSLNGYKTGLSVSPHIESVNERVQVNSTPINEKEFCENLDEFVEILKSQDIKPTYFELFVAFAFWYFAKIKVDYAVIEVGLGGLLDATNVISREDKICVITDIGLDHTEVLGETIEEIVSQKAGIIQNGSKVFCNNQDTAVMNRLKEAANAKNAQLLVNPETEFTSFSVRNFSLAEFVTGLIFKQDSKPQLTEQQLKETSEITVPGRMEKYSIRGKTVILDGAHNSQKIDNLLKSLASEIKPGDCCFVLAVGENKKPHLLKMTQAISKYASHVILTSFRTDQDFKHQSLQSGYMKSYFEDTPTEKAFDLDEAVEKALERPEKMIIFTGSLYMVGPIRAKLKKITA